MLYISLVKKYLDRLWFKLSLALNGLNCADVQLRFYYPTPLLFKLS